MTTFDYQAINKSLWNAKVPHHMQSEFYQMEQFLQGKSSLNPIELNLLGAIEGKSIAHLQCHFGQDSLSLSRLGAHVTGFDFSESAIEQAQQLAKQLQLDTQFMCTSIYAIPKHVAAEQFDIVFTSYGTIGWLPDLSEWAAVIRHLLKPSGKLIMVDFHPVVWMFDNDFTTIEYDYHKSEPIVEEEIGTYADPSAPIKATSVSWNHSLSEIFQALNANGLQLKVFQEPDYSPYNCFKGMHEDEPGKFRFPHLKGRIPMLYALVAVSV